MNPKETPMFRTAICRLLLCASLATGQAVFAQSAQDQGDSAAREQTAARLFDLPAYRLLATRQIHEALKFLPEGQYRRALSALDNPEVVQALRKLIVRSMAQTYTAEELAFLERFLSSPQARAFVGKLGTFEANLMRELVAASLTNPALGEILLGQ
jgi:hypothetical protein